MALTALVIGGTGFLGSGIVDELLSRGWNVTSLGRGRMPHRISRVEFLTVDRSQPGALAAVAQSKKFDMVVDCAAYTAPDVEDAVRAFLGNTRHYVFISTDFVYAPSYEGPFPIKEDAPKETILPYGVGKLACEAVLRRAWTEQQFPFTALRPPHILGAGKALGSGTVEGRDPDLLTHMRAGTGVTMLAEGQLLIQPVWNREIGACIAVIGVNERALGHVYNFTGPDCITTRRYYQIIADVLGVPLRADSISVADYLARWPEKAPFARHRIYDLRHLESTVGYRPYHRVENAIIDSIGWMQQTANRT